MFCSSVISSNLSAIHIFVIRSHTAALGFAPETQRIYTSLTILDCPTFYGSSLKSRTYTDSLIEWSYGDWALRSRQNHHDAQIYYSTLTTPRIPKRRHNSTLSFLYHSRARQSPYCQYTRSIVSKLCRFWALIVWFQRFQSRISRRSEY